LESESVLLTPYENFLYALNSKESKRQYPNRLDKFLVFMGFEGTIEEKCLRLCDLSQRDANLLHSYLIRFGELLDDYLNAADLLTVNDENRLRKKVEIIT
jgi:hypothetical protein